MTEYYVYILTNRSRTIYVGVTNDLLRRVHEHKQKLTPGFASRYNLTKLAYYEITSDISSAILREKQIKGWLRAKKIALIESVNPGWRDLSLPWASSDMETLRFAQGDIGGVAQGHVGEPAQGDIGGSQAQG